MLPKKELKIKVQKDVTTYLTFSLPLCAILSDDRLYSWFYQHFIQLYTLTDEKGNLWVDYLEDRDFYKDVAEYRIYDHRSLSYVKNIMDFIVDKINEGYYVIIFVDEYYLPRKLNYMTNHFLHQLMIYGYDHQSQTLKTVAFDEKQEFKNDDYEYTQLVQAYEQGKGYYGSSAVWVLNETIEIIKLKGNIGTYHFNMELFLEELKTFLLGQGEYSKIRPNNLETNGRQASFNFCVYDELKHHLNNLIHGRNTMDYRYVHLLFEHKKIMYERLMYISSNYQADDENLVWLIQEYSKVVERMKVARNLFFKQMILRLNNIVPELNINEILLRVIDIICFVKDEDQKILTDIYNLLKS